MIEYELSRAVKMLPSISGLELSVQQKANSNDRTEDAVLNASYHGHTVCYRVQYRRDLTTTTVSLLASRQTKEGNTKPDRLIYSPYVNVTCGERLRDMGIGFIDDLGHTFLRVGSLYLFILGRAKRDALTPTRDAGVPSLRALKTTTIKLIYAFFTDPALDSEPEKALLNQTYREINKATGIALGAISSGMEDLMAAEYVMEESPGRRRLINRRKLFERWVQDYGTRLRPKLVMGHYRSSSSSWWRDADIQAWGGRWGGEVAGAKLTNFLTPETAAIYADQLPDSFLINNDLRKDPAGSVEVLRPFWRRPPANLLDCVHPLVVYADLSASDIDRNLETAQRIYDRYLQNIIESA